ncbi:TPA_asm: RNA-directed RNA polymerase, partial [ssRNA phage SRR6960509_11]
MDKPFCSKERRERARRFAALRLSPENLGSVLTSFLDDLSPVQQRVRDCVTSGDFMSLANLSVDPRAYSDPEVYFWDRQATEFLRKYPFPGSEKAARKAALSTFLEAEQACTKTNQRFTASVEHLFTEHERDLVKQIRRHIRYVLGQFDALEWTSEARHGPGTCLLLDNFGLEGGGYVGGEFKFESKISLTPSLYLLAGAVLKQYPLWDSASLAAHGAKRFELVEGNKITTVPKTALTQRVIAIEPMLNVFLQLGLGGMIRRRLGTRGGFNLDNSWKVNQKLAKVGSINGSYSTIDLSSASDMIAYNVVGTLLPYEWFQALDLVRSPTGRIRIDRDEELTVDYEKFSSMGNGATFELETLIFWAVCRACGVPASDLAVFGDDIVVPTAYSSSVISALEFLGFVPNFKKTFTAGPFRESCGKDYFLGRDVRPLYVTKEVDNGQKLVNLANSVRDLGVRRNSASGHTDLSADSRLSPGWFTLLGFIPGDLREVVSSPPYTAFGLWKGGLSHVKDATGTFTPQWRIAPSPKKAGLSLVGLGLLASRLSSATVTTWKTKPWEGQFSFKVEEGIGGGNSADWVGHVR